MICNVRHTSLKCTELPLKPHIITQLVGECCANPCFHKFVFCGRRFQDMTKAVFTDGTGRNEE